MGAREAPDTDKIGIIETHYVDKPRLIKKENFIRAKRIRNMDVVGIASGGNTSYFVVHSWNPKTNNPAHVEVYSAGDGSTGQTSNRRFNLIQGWPRKINRISDVVECKTSHISYDPQSHSQRAVGVYNISAGNNHAVVVQDNMPSTEGKEHTHGRDVLAWGDNQFGQVIPSNRIRVCQPSHPLPIKDEITDPHMLKTVVTNKPESHSQGPTDAKILSNMPLMPIHSRLQAAPTTIVHSNDFNKLSDKLSKNGGEEYGKMLNTIKDGIVDLLEPVFGGDNEFVGVVLMPKLEKSDNQNTENADSTVKSGNNELSKGNGNFEAMVDTIKHEIVDLLDPVFGHDNEFVGIVDIPETENSGEKKQEISAKAPRSHDDEVNVEQIFTAGHNATAAFIGIV
ncbi:hypothetical protein AYI68_g416 [Smittium mucronatum]|uniref:Uncharacterized protein n=1 Tax=Smittium mucronatum TaxID=133383 RepID=A0A1R0H8B4_9FUNG|nr:hypothetical protein AYI68_g416 [Smittium mucronatum]